VISLVLYFVVSVVAAALLTERVRAAALRRNLLDVPNERSSHRTPTPRGGGIAIVSVVVVALVLLALADPAWRGAGWLVAVAAVAVAAVGFIDDRRGVPASRRFAVHAAAVATMLVATRGFGGLDLPGLPDAPWLQFVAALVALVWLLNLFNFMDGIDGLAGMEAAFVSLGLAACVVLKDGTASHLVTLGLVCAGASIGFLVHNWPPARIFMGDVGSGFLGFMLGTLAVLAHREAQLSVWVPAILLATFVADATVTLLRRMARRERWYAAHRSHAYQWLSRRLGGHRPVTVGTLGVNLAWLLPLALLATRRPDLAGVAAALAYLPLLILVVLAGAGRPETPPGHAGQTTDAKSGEH
jgi:Fuc2NAc and GlcNAc transferase